MINALYIILISLIAPTILLLGVFLKKKDAKLYGLYLKIVSIVLSVVFLFRYMLGEDAIQNMYNLTNSPFATSVGAVFGLLTFWFSLIAVLTMCLYGFFRFKLSTNIVKFLTLPLSIFALVFFRFNLVAMLGNNAIKQLSVRSILLAIETAIVFGYCVFIFINETNFKRKEKNEKGNKEKLTFKQVLSMFGVFVRNNWSYAFIILTIFIAVMPPYMLQALFGYAYQGFKVLDFEIPHRIVLYIGIILPFLVFFVLKDKEYAVKKFVLMYICFGTLISFSITRRFAIFSDVTNWPLHLCNTAMYIMPIVLMFNMKRFFYFTYFINVAGAFLAMLMPNYSASTDMFSTSLIVFYINHFIAFFMPILFVALKMFEKPKLKQFIYSMLAFFGYFVLVLIINAVFTGLFEAGLVSQSTDFFFINGDFITDKLGLWAEKLRENFVIVLNIKGIEITFYWLYQLLFFIVYIFIGLAMWFIFESSYQIANGFREIEERKNAVNLEKLALESSLGGRSMLEPEKVEYKNSLVLDNISKRYGNSDVFAVKNASLKIDGGEIFGFLGPNGAGKSTIIKSIVGIQPLTSGNIYVCGYNANSQPVEAKHNIGFVPDHYALYEKLTGREYINYIADLYEVSKEDRDSRIENMVNRFELNGAFDNQMRTYSHGMKQKIAIMSALVHNPKIWILDEPLTGLDPNSILQVKECMREHAKAGNIVFFSSHIIDVVERICDRIAIIKKGEIQTCKTLKEIEESGVSLEQFYMQIINK